MQKFAVMIGLIAFLAPLAGSCSKEEPVPWSRRPLSEAKESLADVAFSLTVPIGLAAKRDERAITWSASGPGAPLVRVALDDTLPPKNPDEGAERALSGKDGAEVVRKESINSGQLVVHHTRGKVVVTVYRDLRDAENKQPRQRTLTCEASAEATGNDSSKTAGDREARSRVTATWLSNICLSLAVPKY